MVLAAIAVAFVMVALAVGAAILFRGLIGGRGGEPAARSASEGDGTPTSGAPGSGGGAPTSDAPASGAAAADLGLAPDDCGVDPTAELQGDTITLASSFPQEGLEGAFRKIATGYKSYFNYVNEQGGVDVGGTKYQIEVVDQNDDYDAAKTAANIRDEVGDGDVEEVFGVFSVVGTSNNIAIRDDLDTDCVPNFFAATGSPAWGNPGYPWMIGSSLVPYTVEATAFAEYLKTEKPDAKVAMLVSDDATGEAYVQGFAKAIEGTNITVVAEERHAPGDTDVEAQMASIAATGPDAFFDGGQLLACSSALGTARELGMDPIATWVVSSCTESKSLIGAAGPAADGVISLSNIKDPQNPEWDGDQAMELYRTEVEKFSPGEDTDNGVVAYGWTQGALFVEALKTAESVTRQNVMTAVRTMDGISAGLLLPDVSITTSADDKFMGETFSLVQYSTDDQYFTLLGDLQDHEGKTLDYTPEDLLTS